MKYLKLYYTSILLFFIVPGVFAKAASADTANVKTKSYHSSSLYIGAGAGLDYGGLGFKIEALPTRFTGIFLGAGSRGVGLEFNAGLSVKLAFDKTVQPYLTGMYGYNTLVKTDNQKETFNGYSAGVGLDVMMDRHNNKFSLALLVPVSSDELPEGVNERKTIRMSFGFNLALN